MKKLLKNKKVILVLSLLLLVLIIMIVLFTRNKSLKFLNDNMPKDIFIYELNNKEYTNKVKEIRINSDTITVNNKREIEVEFDLEDENIKETIKYKIIYKKNNGDWILDEYKRLGTRDYHFIGKVSEDLVSSYLENISNYEFKSNECDNNTCLITYEVNESHKYINTKGNLIFTLILGYSNNSFNWKIKTNEVYEYEYNINGDYNGTKVYKNESTNHISFKISKYKEGKFHISGYTEYGENGKKEFDTDIEVEENKEKLEFDLLVENTKWQIYIEKDECYAYLGGQSHTKSNQIPINGK